MVDANEVRVVAFKAQQALRDHMLAIPGRLAPQLAAESDENRVHATLSDAIRTALSEVADKAAILRSRSAIDA